jgi:uncharacterized membrane protein
MGFSFLGVSQTQSDTMVCSKCGSEVQTGVAFCPRYGQAQSGGEMTTTTTSQSAQPGIAENVAGALCYVLGWVTGIIFLLIDKRPYVRFHAAQSIVVFGGLHILNVVVGIIFGAGFMMMGRFGGFGLGAALYGLISLVAFVLWIVLMVKAYQGEKFQVPVAAGIAQSFTGK